MNDILIIGGGIFGLDAGVALSKYGYPVTIFEQNKEILTGTSGSSLLRIHSGLHYPRDISTAKQSKEGELNFRKKYSECINYSFKNYYAISKTDTRTSSQEFEKFANILAFPYRECKNNFEFHDYIKMEKISSIYEAKEGVADINSLRENFYTEIFNLGIDLKKQHRVTGINKRRDHWEVKYEIEGELKNNFVKLEECKKFKYVIDATHGANRKKFSNKQFMNELEYQVTHMINIETKIPIFGLTVLDGNFITIMPNGFNQSTLVYGPKQSILAREATDFINEEWFKSEYLNSLIPDDAEDKLIDLFNDWINGSHDIKLLSSVTGIRIIESNVTQSDRRLSFVEVLDEGFFSITSTKIDHSPGITNELCKKINLIK